MAVYDTQIKTHKRDKWKLITDARKVLDKAEAETRALSTEERAEVDRMQGAIDEHDGRIEDLERLNADEPDEDREDNPDEFNNAEDPEEAYADQTRDGRGKGRESRRVGSPIKSGPRTRDSRAHATKEYRAAFRHWMQTGEKRDVTVATGASGGSLVAPVQMSEDIVKQIDNLVFVRALAKVSKVSMAQALGVRQMTARASDAAWTTEIASVGAADSTWAFARRDLTPNLLSKLVLVSLKMLEVMPDVETEVNSELAYKFSVAEENAYMNGTGAGQPLGVFTASASGVPTSQDYAGTNTTTAITADTIAGARYQLKQPYMQGKSVAWAWSRAAISQIRLLKDAQNRYLLVDGGGLSGAPDTITGIPYFISEYVPNTFTTGLYVGMLANWSYYRIAELRDLWIQRLVEKYADTNEVGFIGRRFFDGAPVLGEAFLRIKLG